MKQREFKIVVESPYGKRPLSQFENWVRKVADEADTRWGINISIERINETDEDVSKDEFSD